MHVTCTLICGWNVHFVQLTHSSKVCINRYGNAGGHSEYYCLAEGSCRMEKGSEVGGWQEHKVCGGRMGAAGEKVSWVWRDHHEGKRFCLLYLMQANSKFLNSRDIKATKGNDASEKKQTLTKFYINFPRPAREAFQKLEVLRRLYPFWKYTYKEP